MCELSFNEWNVLVQTISQVISMAATVVLAVLAFRAFGPQTRKARAEDETHLQDLVRKFLSESKGNTEVWKEGILDIRERGFSWADIKRAVHPHMKHGPLAHERYLKMKDLISKLETGKGIFD